MNLEHLVQNWTVRKPLARSRNGVVASQSRIAAAAGDTVGVDPRLPEAVRNALTAAYPVSINELLVYPSDFACPSAVLCDTAGGELQGITDVLSPWSGAVAAG